MRGLGPYPLRAPELHPLQAACVDAGGPYKRESSNPLLLYPSKSPQQTPSRNAVFSCLKTIEN